MKNIISTLVFCVFFISVFAQEPPTIYPKKENGKYGFINKNGSIQIDYTFDDALGFTQGLAAVKKDGKWGYISESGAVVIDYQYESAWYFTQSLAAVKNFGLWGYIDLSGNLKIAYQFDDAGDFSDGLAWVMQVKRIGFIDQTGKTIIEYQYNAAGSFVDGLAPVQKAGLWGFIDKTGKTKIEFQYDNAKPFDSYDLAPVKKSGSWGYIDQTGTLVVNYQFTEAKDKYRDADFGWKYAETTYNFCTTNAGESRAKYVEHLKKALTLIETQQFTFTSSEWEKLIKYYKEAGLIDKATAAEKQYKQKLKDEKPVTYRTAKNSTDFSIAVAPVKIGMRYSEKYPTNQFPVYAQLRIVRVGFGARYNEYKDYVDKFKFGAWTGSTPDSVRSLTYSGQEFASMLYFFGKDGYEKGLAGYGYSGGYWGFEYRMGRFDVKSIMTDVTEITTGNTGYGIMLNPKIKVQDFCLNFGFCHSRGLFFFDFNYSLGLGLKEIDLGEVYGTKLNLTDYTYSDERLKKERWVKYYIPMRIAFRMGINLF